MSQSLTVVREDEESMEVEDDEEEGDNTIEVNDNCLENPTPIEVPLKPYWTLVFLSSQKRFNAAQ